MLNKVFLQGRLVADPELKQTPSGVSVATFRIAVDRDFKDKETGEKVADFVTIVAWRGTGEFVAKYFTKGRMAVVEGRLQIRPYTDKDDNKRSATEVVAANVYFGDSPKNGGNGQQGDSAGSTAGGDAPFDPFAGSDCGDGSEDDGDYPF